MESFTQNGSHYARSSHNKLLIKTQQQQYWDEGFLFPISAVSSEQSQAWREALETIEHDWFDRNLPRPLNTYKRVNAHIVMPIAYEIAACPTILDVVESILGPDILLYSTEFLIKEPQTKHV